MKNKLILVTGGSSGVGKAIVNYLSRENKVVTLARRYERLKSLYSCNKNVFYYQADLYDLTNLNEVLQKIDQEHGEIAYIVNCAGAMQAGKLEQLSPEELCSSITLNAFAAIEIVKHYLTGMQRNNFGRVINLTSGAPLNCFPGYAAYSASKAVLNSLTVTLAKEMKEFDIKINLMSPGPVKSEMAPDAPMEPEVCLPTLNYLLKDCTETGGFFWLGYQIPLFPDLGDIDWLGGKGSDKLKRIFHD
ncbi:MAG TPA: NAD(P)-dependent oxidoreductase [Butyricimonas sp.]|jgi:short-subunit dehydrogenase|uniref:SDR family NAD(P)-dependent oxidoreductase n=1 Tax=Butyricimonas TaxID=574697 RepID=UPI000EE42EAA|nr:MULTISPECIES: SDR family oxidoreductase [Butyricimonas]HAM84988.1 NAD(P)-dependent oxidoreductase [Butyricimonas sp.]HCH90627.1 NAD(P)-dependent oxidoreductase [Butyricimonas sp.]